MAIVDEKSVTHTSQFLLTLEARMGFKIKTIQTDNGREFTNYGMKDRLCLFDKVLEELHIEHILTRPYSPWQNGKVERSHRIDGERFCCRTFSSFEQLVKAHKRYESRYNNIVQKVPGSIIAAFFPKFSAKPTFKAEAGAEKAPEVFK